jgi:glucans biosynthesis protein
MTYRRNTTPMLQSPRCGAKTRADGSCRAPAVRGKRRCRMHGGAAGSGAPAGNRNALKHGVFTREALERRAHLNKLIREADRLLKELS